MPYLGRDVQIHGQGGLLLALTLLLLSSESIGIFEELIPAQGSDQVKTKQCGVRCVGLQWENDTSGASYHN